MNKNLLKCTVFATTALGLGVGVAPAMAQEDVADIVVTARRVEERLQDVPISIQVFNQEQLAQQNIVNAGDLATVTPSLSSNNLFGGENTNFALRGFVQDTGTAPSVGTYFADAVGLRAAAQTLNAGDGAGPGSFFDLQNVQVLKGPQGTLFGRNTTGGAVLLVPQRPTDEFGGYISGSVGNFDMSRIQAVLNVPLGDSARLRLGMDRQEREGYVNNNSGIGPRDFNDVNYQAYRASFVVDLAPNLENYTVATYSLSNTNGPLNRLFYSPSYTGAGVSECGVDPNCAQLYNQGPGFYDAQQVLQNPENYLQQWQVVNTTTWDINDNLTFKNIASYGELVNDFQSEIFGINWLIPVNPLETGPFPSGFYNYNYAASVPIDGGHVASQSTFSNEMRLEGRSFDDRLSWQAGFYAEESHPLGYSGNQAPVAATCLDFTDPTTCYGTPSNPFDTIPETGTGSDGVLNVNRSRTNFSNRGLYAQGTYEVTDQFKFTLGYRYTWDDAELTSQQYINFLYGPYAAFGRGFSPFQLCTNGSALADCSQRTTVHTEAPTWLIGVDYSPTDNLLLYAKYSRGYRAGSVSPGLPAGYNATDAEQVEAYEIGQKWSFGGPLHGILNTALFYNDFSNQQLQLNVTSNGAPTAAAFNVGSSEIYGLEVEGSVRPFTGLTLSANYTYLHTEIKAVTPPVDNPGLGLVFNSSISAGDRLAQTPEHKYSLNAQYVLPLSENVGEVTLGATFVHIGEQVTNYVPFYRVNGELSGYNLIDDINLVNLNLRWDSIAGSPVDLLLFGTNVTDEEYFTNISGTFPSFGGETAAVGAPRMYGAQLTYHFGAR